MTRIKVSLFDDLDSYRDHYLEMVDKAAEERLGAKLAVSEMRLAKLEEARAGDGPLIRAESEALGLTVEEVRESVLRAREEWLSSCATLESSRVLAKRKIRSAQKPSEMHKALGEFTQALN